MSKRDYYAVLDLLPSCTPLDIRQNFKRLALRWHPDKCFDKTEAQHKFNEINEAYTVLSDNRKKQIYDQHGHKGIEIDQENGNQGVFAQENFFFRKGFQGTQKSAFDFLKDILIDSDEEEEVFANKQETGFSDTLKATLQSFMEDEDFSHKKGAETSFFESYTPTFMNPEFLLPPPGFEGEIADASYTSSIFSFFTRGSDEKTYTSTSTTFTQNGTTINSVHETFSSNTNNVNTNTTEIIFEDSYKRSTPSVNNNKGYDDFYINKSMFNNQDNDERIIVINDYDDDDVVEPLEFPKKDIRLTNKRTSDEIIEELNAQLRDQVSLKSKKISKDKDSLNIRLMNKKPSKKNRS